MPSDGNTSHDPSNQTDLTGKYNSHMIAHCVISQVRKMISGHIVFELLTGLQNSCYLEAVGHIIIVSSGYGYF